MEIRRASRPSRARRALGRSVTVASRRGAPRRRPTLGAPAQRGPARRLSPFRALLAPARSDGRQRQPTLVRPRRTQDPNQRGTARRIPRPHRSDADRPGNARPDSRRHLDDRGGAQVARNGAAGRAAARAQFDRPQVAHDKPQRRDHVAVRFAVRSATRAVAMGGGRHDHAPIMRAANRSAFFTAARSS